MFITSDKEEESVRNPIYHSDYTFDNNNNHNQNDSESWPRYQAFTLY